MDCEADWFACWTAWDADCDASRIAWEADWEAEEEHCSSGVGACGFRGLRTGGVVMREGGGRVSVLGGRESLIMVDMTRSGEGNDAAMMESIV